LLTLTGVVPALVWGRGQFRHLSGTRLQTWRAARALARRALPPGDPGLEWGGVPVPWAEAPHHFYVVGMSGSGKTITLRLLMQQVLPGLGTGRAGGHRAVIYDSKGDLLPILAGMRDRGPLHGDIYTLNPFDGRHDEARQMYAVGWDIARDCPDEITALEIATILCPVPRHEKNFFEQAARNILYGVLLGLREAAGTRWRFEDVFIALREQASIERLMQRTAKGRSLHHYAFGRRERVDDVLNTLVGTMTAYEPIAALWSHAEKRLSLQEWVEGESLLVLSHSEKAETAVHAINRVLLTRLAQLLLDQPDSDTRRSWLFLDEVPKIRSWEKLELLLTNGRSKGICCVLGFQDIEGTQEAYGEKKAHSLINQCASAALLKAQGNTARWEAQMIGEYEALVRRYGRSFVSNAQGGSSGLTSQEQYERREAVFHAEFQNLPPTNRRNGLWGYYRTAATGAFGPVHYPGPELFDRMLWPKDPTVPEVEPRPPGQQTLPVWTQGDWLRLGLETGFPRRHLRVLPGRGN
jgi:type IV secretory pathway TraG/TraD family ATPase VirD4